MKATNTSINLKTNTRFRLLAILAATSLCLGSADAVTINEWLFDVPPTGAQFVAYNEVPGGMSMAELQAFVAYTDLQVNGGPFVATVGGQSLYLQTGGNYAAARVANGTNWAGSTAITVEAWINPSSGFTGTRDVAFDGGNGIRLTSTSGGFNMQGFIYNGSYVGTATGSILIPYDTWTHVAMTYDGSTISTYVGNQLDKTFSITTTLASNVSNSYFGMFSNQNYFKGYIDEIRTSDVALLPGDGSGNGTLAWNASLATVPEPGPVAMSLTAGGCFLFLRLLRRKRSS